MFGFFKKKKENEDINRVKQAVQTGFNNVKQDMNSLTQWIKHLDSKDNDIKNEIYDINNELTTIKDEIENLKNFVSLAVNKSVFKHKQTFINKQTAVQDVLNTVQTGVQTLILENLTPNERAIIFMLLNTDMKLSYEDLAAMFGKNKSTIRGQINSIKQKSGGLIEEVIGENNKKRVYIPEKTKETLLKMRKVKVKDKKKGKERGD